MLEANALISPNGLAVSDVCCCMLEDKADRSKRRLENLRYFERVRYYLEKTDAGETRQIIHHTDLIVGRTRSDDQQALLAFAGKNIPDLLIPFFFDPAHIFGQREKILDLHWNRQFPFKIHIHKKTSIK